MSDLGLSRAPGPFFFFFFSPPPPYLMGGGVGKAAAGFFFFPRKVNRRPSNFGPLPQTRSAGPWARLLPSPIHGGRPLRHKSPEIPSYKACAVQENPPVWLAGGKRSAKFGRFWQSRVSTAAQESDAPCGHEPYGVNGKAYKLKCNWNASPLSFPSPGKLFFA